MATKARRKFTAEFKRKAMLLAEENVAASELKLERK